MGMGMLGSKRGKRAARRIDLGPIREALDNGLVWNGTGIVVVPDGEESHWENDEDIGVLIHVELMPHRTPLMCRLGGLGGADTGVWRIPPVGTEVTVELPGGTVEADAVLTASMASGTVPSELDEDTLVVKAPRIVVLGSTEVIVGAVAGAEVTIKGSTYRTAEDTLLTALNTYIAAIQAIADPTGVATTTLTTAINNFQAAASTYLTTKAKVS